MNTNVTERLPVIDAEETTPDNAARHRMNWKLLSGNGTFAVDPSRCDLWSGNTREVAALGGASFDELKASLEAVGQQVAVIARISPLDPSRLQVIAGACRLTAIQQLSAEQADKSWQLVVELRDLDDEAALKTVDAENRGRSDLAPIEKARFYQHAIDSIYHADKWLAEALGLHKSTVSRTLSILKLPPALYDLISDVRQISAAQTSEFMTNWAVPQLQETLEEAISGLIAEDRKFSAAALFKALREAVSEPVSTVPVMGDDAQLGEVREGKGGAITIVLNAATADVPVKPILIAIGNALVEQRKTR